MNKYPSHRQQKVGEQIRKSISLLLIKDESNILSLKDYLVSIVDVDMSPDLKNARIYIAISGDKNNEEVIKDLNKKTGYIKKKISKNIKLKFLPNLKFLNDSSIEYSKNINNILKNLA